MDKLEKVIKGLECCSKMAGTVCRTCPYANECEESDALLGGAAHLAADALELLKSDYLVKVIRCKDCQMWRSPSEEDISDGITTGYCNNAGFGTEPFDFCSDAIRR